MCCVRCLHRKSRIFRVLFFNNKVEIFASVQFFFSWLSTRSFAFYMSPAFSLVAIWRFSFSTWTTTVLAKWNIHFSEAKCSSYLGAVSDRSFSFSQQNVAEFVVFFSFFLSFSPFYVSRNMWKCICLYRLCCLFFLSLSLISFIHSYLCAFLLIKCWNKRMGGH